MTFVSWWAGVIRSSCWCVESIEALGYLTDPGTTMRLQVREQGDEVHIEVSGVAGRHQRVLQALTECSRGLCGVTGQASLHPQDVSVRAGTDEIRIRLKGRGGLRFEPLAIYRCMRHALIEERAAPMTGSALPVG